MERQYNYSSSDWDRHRDRAESSPSRGRARDMYQSYSRSPERSDYRHRDDYERPRDGPPPVDPNWRERRSPPRRPPSPPRRPPSPSPPRRSPSPRRIPPRPLSPVRYGSRGRSPDRRRTPPARSPKDYRERSPSDYQGSLSGYSSDRRRSATPDRRVDRYRSSSRDRCDERRPRSPPHPLPPGEEDFVPETTVIRVNGIPEDISETEIRLELQMSGASVCSVEMEQLPGTEGLRGRVCFVEFTDIRASTKWMQQQKVV